MKRSDFSYDLPPALIAQQPRERGKSRMMVVTPGEGIEHKSIADFPSLLALGDVLVLNDTAVFPARLYATRPGLNRSIEFLLTKRIAPMKWECWCKPARRVRVGSVVYFSPRLDATVTEKRDDGTVVLEFGGDGREESFWEEIENIGVTPLPPYIERETPRDEDREAYQTVYASKRGAIAAPTAGLHFTDELLRDIATRGVEIAKLTLHVGIGTFKPVKVENIAEHKMEVERYEFPQDVAEKINRALSTKRRIVAVGTTSVRALESAIRAGDGRIRAGEGETSLFITPGFEFRVVDALLTNFHLPESTLMMLVSAFAGIETIRAAYREAIEKKYLFYSFGDCMFITRAQGSGLGARE